MRAGKKDSTAHAMTRREVIGGTGLGALALTAAGDANAKTPAVTVKDAFGYCLNTATIRKDGIGLVERFEIAAASGYTGVEPWIREIEGYVKEGASLGDLKKRLEDWDLSVENAIGFARWSVDDEEKRREGVEQLKRDMDLVAQLGGKRIAASPAGSNRVAVTDLSKLAERYSAVLEIGRETGVVPQLEIWGSSKTLSKVSEAAFVAVESGHPDACLLLDVFHLYRGGSGFEGLRLLNGRAMNVLHMNDYPADPPRDSIKDSHRVYPGDGVAPLDFILRTLHEIGFRGMLSLEVFNPNYWQQDPLHVAKTGIEKMRAAVQSALGTLEKN